MKKHRITMTAVLEFEVDPANYEGLDTDEERLAADLESLSDWPEEMVSNEKTKIVFIGEIID